MRRRQRVAPSVWRRHTKDGVPRYEIQMRSGKRMIRETVDSFTEAQDRVAELRLMKRDGLLVDTPTAASTFATASEKWLDAEVTWLRPSTSAELRGRVEAPLWPRSASCR